MPLLEDFQTLCDHSHLLDLWQQTKKEMKKEIAKVRSAGTGHGVSVRIYIYIYIHLHICNLYRNIEKLTIGTPFNEGSNFQKFAIVTPFDERRREVVEER